MSLINVKVNNETITKRNGTSTKTNKPYTLYSQEVIIELDGEVRKLQINRPDEMHYFPAGSFIPLTLLRC